MDWAVCFVMGRNFDMDLTIKRGSNQDNDKASLSILYLLSHINFNFAMSSHSQHGTRNERISFCVLSCNLNISDYINIFN